MTLPEEWFYSLNHTRNFLFDLLDPTAIKKIPKETRARASMCLKHYPLPMDIETLKFMHTASHKDKNIIISETNKEIAQAKNEIFLAQKRLHDLTNALQEFINKP